MKLTDSEIAEEAEAITAEKKNVSQTPVRNRCQLVEINMKVIWNFSFLFKNTVRFKRFSEKHPICRSRSLTNWKKTAPTMVRTKVCCEVV
jgi:hypothetical protein